MDKFYYLNAFISVFIPVFMELDMNAHNQSLPTISRQCEIQELKYSPPFNWTQFDRQCFRKLSLFKFCSYFASFFSFVCLATIVYRPHGVDPLVSIVLTILLESSQLLFRRRLIKRFLWQIFSGFRKKFTAYLST